MPRRRLGAVPLRRLDRRLGGAGRPDLLPRRVQRLLGRLPRPDRLPRLYGRQYLRGQERLFRRGPVAQGPAARACATTWGTSARPSRTSTATSWSSAPRADRASSGTSGRPSIRPSGRTDTPSRSGTNGPASSTTRSPSTGASITTSGHILERDWPKIGKKLEGKIHIYVGDMDNYLSEQRRLPGGGLPQEDQGPGLRRRSRPTATARSIAGTATRPGPTPSAGSAITRCSPRGSSSDSSSRPRRVPTSRAGGTEYLL